MTQKLLAITTINPDEPEALEQYMKVVVPLIESVGAKLLYRYEVKQTVIGGSLPQFFSLMEYPDENAIKAVFESDTYKALKEVREKAFSHYQIAVIARI